MNTAMIFLVLLIPQTERPTIVLMASFETVKECNQILVKVPPEQKNKWACLTVDLKPQNEGVKL